MPRARWQNHLDPFGDDLERRITAASNDELRKLDAATQKVTAANTWWLSAELAPIIRRRIHLEVMLRQSRGAWTPARRHAKRCGAGT